MFEISKTFRFSAAHHLPGVPEGHKCRRVHGHNYTLTVRLRAAELRGGMVRDYGELQPVADWLGMLFDHRDLNEALPNPTAEVLAHAVFDRFKGEFPELYAVTVSETPGTTATYVP